MFRSLIIATALFNTATAFGNGPECANYDPAIVDEGIEKGNCIKHSECTTKKWFFGTSDNPVCDEPGTDYPDNPENPSVKVCCFD